jgi:hypothetical protein
MGSSFLDIDMAGLTEGNGVPFKQKFKLGRVGIMAEETVVLYFRSGMPVRSAPEFPRIVAIKAKRFTLGLDLTVRIEMTGGASVLFDWIMKMFFVQGERSGFTFLGRMAIKAWPAWIGLIESQDERNDKQKKDNGN